MDKKYSDWIQNNYPDGGYGKCSEATQNMVEFFPELRRVRGHYYCSSWGERAHWWCEVWNEKEIKLEIVDPTANQFPSMGLGHYEEWGDYQEEPTGKCMNCGDYCYENRYFCSKGCEATVMVDFL